MARITLSLLAPLAAALIVSSIATSALSNVQAANLVAAPSARSERTADGQEAAAASDLALRLRLMESRLETQERNFNLLLAMFAVFAAIFGLFPTISQYLSQRRERATQDTFLKGSADTIRLVNDTLGLAKEASERAADSAERRARAELAELDSLSQEIIIRASQKDDREIVANPSNRAELEGLAERIHAFDIYTVMLDEKVILTPHCYFIKGIHAHLKQHFDEAIKLWRRCALNTSADSPLRSLAWYWIGYESNNLGKFQEARDSFDEARKLADENRSLELKRISIESEFFFKEQYKTAEALSAILSLLNEAETRQNEYGIGSYVDAIRLTAGNMSYVYGRELAASPKAAERKSARSHYTRARQIYGRIGRQSKWSELGFAQCSLRLRVGVDKAREAMGTRIRFAARDEFVKRVEPRSKVLARLTELVCTLAGGSSEGEVEGLYGQVLSSLGDVDNRLTLYSLRQRRNVTKDDFRRDLDEIVAEGTGA